MGLTLEQEINGAIEFLEAHGYIVKKDYSTMIGKWVVFVQEGMDPFLHGKIIDIIDYDIFKIRCKNGEIRYARMKDIYRVFNEDEKPFVME